jgi:hypothetical protein
MAETTKTGASGELMPKHIAYDILALATVSISWEDRRQPGQIVTEMVGDKQIPAGSPAYGRYLEHILGVALEAWAVETIDGLEDPHDNLLTA